MDQVLFLWKWTSNAKSLNWNPELKLETWTVFIQPKNLAHRNQILEIDMIHDWSCCLLFLYLWEKCGLGSTKRFLLMVSLDLVDQEWQRKENNVWQMIDYEFLISVKKKKKKHGLEFLRKTLHWKIKSTSECLFLPRFWNLKRYLVFKLDDRGLFVPHDHLIKFRIKFCLSRKRYFGKC